MTPRRAAILRSYYHIGHHLWNELAGLDAMLGTPWPATPPLVIVADPHAVEMWGAIEAVFPEFNGHVTRTPTVRAAIRHVYAHDLLPLRPTAHRISRAMADRLIALSKDPCQRALPGVLTRGLRNSGYHFVVLGLRVENRTIVDLAGFYEHTIRVLAAALGRVAIIIDGQNCSESGYRYRVTLQEAAAGSPEQVEHDVIAHLRRCFSGDDTIIIISTVGLPVRASIAICHDALCFIAPWGAALAKYRWVCNLPGLIIAGPSCAHLQPLHLYDDPLFMESPQPVFFMEPGDVEDAPDDPVLMPGGEADRVNVRVAPDALARRVTDLLASLRASGRAAASPTLAPAADQPAAAC
jgi:hypothetical protein